MSDKKVDIIIPTFNNNDLLMACLRSIIVMRDNSLGKIFVINNGQKMEADVPEYVQIINVGENLGWEGGLKIGLELSKASHVVFKNDDTLILNSESGWLKKLDRTLSSYPDVAAVGPSSNVVMGVQNIFHSTIQRDISVRFLIGFCMMIRRSDLDACGGVDDTLPGGDDIDLSIRLRSLGKALVVRRDVFVYHHGFKTGERIHGGSGVAGGWNSDEMTEKTNKAIIDKHGFKEWWKTLTQQVLFSDQEIDLTHDAEGEWIRSNIDQNLKILELGCGSTRTVEKSVCVDRVAKGEIVPDTGQPSVADIALDVNEGMSFTFYDVVICRHILEHCMDTVQTLRKWMRTLREGGSLILTCPNENLCNSIELNEDHVHAFTPDSLFEYFMLLGHKVEQVNDNINGTSFGMVVTKGHGHD